MLTLSATNLEKSFKKRKVVCGVSLTLGREIVGLLGPNGAGKTTSFYMLVGLVRPDAGAIQLGNKDISHLALHKRARLGISYLPQETSVFRQLTVADNVMAILQLRRDLSKRQRQEKLEALLEEFRLTHIRDVIGVSLSGGEKRRVEIARALALQPKFILLDEPFAGIDPISVIDIKRIITHINDRGIGVLITDHNVRETLDICKRAYIVNEGKIIANGIPKQILANQQVRDVYLGHEFDL